MPQTPLIVNYPPEKRPLLSPGEKKTALVGGAGVAGTGYLYARGLKGENRWRDIPSKVRRAGVFGQALRKGGEPPGQVAHSIVSTIRKGVASTGADIGSVSSGLWSDIKGAGKAAVGKRLSVVDSRLIQLNSKLDDLIEFQGFHQGLAVGMTVGRQQAKREQQKEPVHRRILSNTGIGYMPKFKLSESEFKERFGMTPDELNRVTKTGPYKDKKKHRLAKLTTIYGLGGLTGAGIATGSVATRNLLSKVGRFLKPVAK